MRTIFVGDVHGCARELDDLLAELGGVNFQFGERLIFVGDLVDKGPDSLGVLRHVRTLQEDYGSDSVIAVAGNHEEKASRKWKKQGIAVEPWVRDATEEDWNFIDSMPLTWYDPNLDIRVVHGGIYPRLLERHPDVFERIEGKDWRKGGGKVMNRARRMLRVRYVAGPHRQTPKPGQMLSLGENGELDPFWADTYDGSHGMVIYGHSPWLSGEIRPATNGDPFGPYTSIGIDTGCVFGGKLTAYEVSGEAPDAVVRVEARKRYAEPLEED